MTFQLPPRTAPIPGPGGRRTAGRRRAAVALATTLALTATLAGAPSAVAHHRPDRHDTAVVTRAALDPGLVAGRGADVGFVEQEAEHAATTGTVLPPDRTPYTLASEASGRSAVQLRPGEHVQLTLPAAANAVTVRYSIPDAADGGGIISPLDVRVLRDHGRFTTPAGPRHRMELTSEYSWLYNTYPFTNDPQADLLQPDWWLTECACVPGESDPEWLTTPFRPHHFYDEQRLLLGRTYPAGSLVRLEVPPGATADVTTIDLLDSELVDRPAPRPRGSVSVVRFGADPSGRRDSGAAFQRAVDWASAHDRTLWIPRGTFQVNRHVVVDDVTVVGAGSWYSIVRGHEVALDGPTDDGSVHTGVGFYGRWAADGGSHDVHLSGFAIEGDVRERIDTDQVNGVGGAMSDSTLTDLYIHHTKVGVWFDGPMDGTHVTDVVITDQIGDGVNFHTGVTGSSVTDSFFRNTGDDALAMWADAEQNVGNTFARNTVQSPVLANGIAIYGGRDIAVVGNLVADPVREGSALHAGARFGALPFEGTLTFRDNTTVRAGGLDLNWNIGLGAIWFYALDRGIDADVQVSGDHYLDSTYNAIMLVTEYGVKDEYAIDGVSFRDVRVDGAGTSVVSARTAGSASFENVDVRHVGWAGVNNCGAFTWDFANGSEFVLTDLGDNDGETVTPWGDGPASWLSRYTPNTISCQDAPPVVEPPAPAPW
ncbi:glycosyl hydrolase family 28-related protein [Isoptericola aurantiacus]|uniref:glycosyl hydrolase family 28-related protein n=1 Tax=Isoptericola aurantiacus TaxID=3377839 RepID=UPI00383B9686